MLKVNSIEEGYLKKKNPKIDVHNTYQSELVYVVGRMLVII